MNPTLLTYVAGKPTPRAQRCGRRRERRIRKRLEAEMIKRLVAEYVAGTPSAELGQRYGIAKSTVLRLVRQAGERVRYPRLTVAERAQLVALHEEGWSQKDIAERLDRSPGAIWHCLRRLGLTGSRTTVSDFGPHSAD